MLKRSVISLGIIFLFIVSTIVTLSFGLNVKNTKQLSTKNINNTHTVLGEFGTTTPCYACKFAHGALIELYSEGQLDFHYITYVCDENYKANFYCGTHYSMFGVPNVWWDGGYKVKAGAGSVPSAKSNYSSSINQSLSRAVYDVDIVLNVTWLGGTDMEVECTVKNYENNTYNGTIQVAICEKFSSMGWIDSGGRTYTQTFLDWAFKEPLSIPIDGNWSGSMKWNGSSNGYPTVTQGNIIVIAAAYNDDWHQGYTWPPDQQPFDAYYVDECVAFELYNNTQPATPIITGPANGNAGTEYTYTFSSIDPDGNDVYFYILWDDGNVDIWDGPYNSGANINFNHTYVNKRTYTIKAKAKDYLGAESDWSELQVTMPRDKAINSNNILIKILERFPLLHRLLDFWRCDFLI